MLHSAHKLHQSFPVVPRQRDSSARFHARGIQYGDQGRCHLSCNCTLRSRFPPPSFRRALAGGAFKQAADTPLFVKISASATPATTVVYVVKQIHQPRGQVVNAPAEIVVLALDLARDIFAARVAHVAHGVPFSLARAAFAVQLRHQGKCPSWFSSHGRCAISSSTSTAMESLAFAIRNNSKLTLAAGKA